MDLFAGLRSFARVAELGSFAAVAREANTNHSAVTRQIGHLEEHFGARLFHRTTRRLSLTDDGSILLDHARRILEDAASMEDQLGGRRLSPTGRVRVGMPVAVAMFIVTRLPALLRKYPGLSVDLVVDDYVRDMVDAQIDIAIRGGRNQLRAGPNGDSSLIARVLGSFPSILVAAPEYINRAGEPKTPEDLKRHECIVQGTTQDNRAIWRFGSECEPWSVQINGTLAVDEAEVARRAALTGYGIARMPGIHVIDDIREGRLVRVLAEFPPTPVPIHMVYPTRRHLAPRVRVVMEFLAEQMELGRKELTGKLEFIA